MIPLFLDSQIPLAKGEYGKISAFFFDVNSRALSDCKVSGNPK